MKRQAFSKTGAPALPASCKVKSLGHDDGGEWQVFDLRRDLCDGLPIVARSKFRQVCYGDEMHVHRHCVEIFLCLKGSVSYETADGEVRILPGEIFLSSPDQPHRRISSPKGMCLYRAIFGLPRPSGRILGLTREETRFIVQAFMGFGRRTASASARVRSAFERLFKVCETERRGTAGRRLNVKSAALELLLALVETLQSPSPCTDYSCPKVEAIVRRIEEEPSADYSVPFLAREAALSSVALNNAFKRLTGLTPHAYLLDVRVRRARADLERGQAIAAVAAKYRFPSPAHFATIFRRIVGLSPRDCRELRKNNI